MDEGLIQRSPLTGVRRPKVADDSQTTGLDRDQLRAVLAVARQRAATGAGQSARNLALVTLLAHNGLRIGEALAADVEDVGTERGHRTLRIIRKGARRATIVLAPVTAQALDDYPSERDSGPLFITAGAKRLDSRPPSAWCDVWPEPPAWTAPTGSAPTACAMPS
jgi:integrase/recombinase XerD